MPNENGELESQYGIVKGYRHRSNTTYFDDTGLKDEWQREVYLEAADLMSRCQFSTIYDVGCGSGYKLVTYLGEYNTVGFDVPETVAFLKERYPNRKWVADLPTGGFEKADLVISADVIEHVLDPDSLLRFIGSVSKRHIILSTPDRSLLHSTEDPLFLGPPLNPTHVREWTFDEFAAYVSRHFEILSHRITNRGQATQMIVCQQQ